MCWRTRGGGDEGADEDVADCSGDGGDDGAADAVKYRGCSRAYWRSITPPLAHCTYGSLIYISICFLLYASD